MQAEIAVTRWRARNSARVLKALPTWHRAVERQKALRHGPRFKIAVTAGASGQVEMHMVYPHHPARAMRKKNMLDDQGLCVFESLG